MIKQMNESDIPAETNKPKSAALCLADDIKEAILMNIPFFEFIGYDSSKIPYVVTQAERAKFYVFQKLIFNDSYIKIPLSRKKFCESITVFKRKVSDEWHLYCKIDYEYMNSTED